MVITIRWRGSTFFFLFLASMGSSDCIQHIIHHHLKAPHLLLGFAWVVFEVRWEQGKSLGGWSAVWRLVFDDGNLQVLG